MKKLAKPTPAMRIACSMVGKLAALQAVVPVWTPAVRRAFRALAVELEARASGKGK